MDDEKTERIMLANLGEAATYTEADRDMLVAGQANAMNVCEQLLLAFMTLRDEAPNHLRPAMYAVLTATARAMVDVLPTASEFGMHRALYDARLNSVRETLLEKVPRA